MPLGILLHEELAWFASDDGERIGVLIRDRVDHDYSWVLMKRDAGEWRAVDLAASIPDIDTARTQLLQEIADDLHRYR
jgi:hypothetical protein